MRRVLASVLFVCALAAVGAGGFLMGNAVRSGSHIALIIDFVCVVVALYCGAVNWRIIWLS